MKNIICTLSIFILFLSGCSGQSGLNTDAASKNKKTVGAKTLATDMSLLNSSDPVVSRDSSQPSIAYDNINKKYMAVWSDYRKGLEDSDIYGRICDASTAGLGLQASSPVCGPEFPISTDTLSQNQPKVAFDTASQRYLVLWTNTTSGTGTELKATTLNSSGAVVIPPFIFSPTTGLESVFSGQNITVSYSGHSEPDLAYNPVTKKFIVAWVATVDRDTLYSETVRGNSCPNKAHASALLEYVPSPMADLNMVMTTQIDGAAGTPSFTTPAPYTDIAFISATDDDASITRMVTVKTGETKPKIIKSSTGEFFVGWVGSDKTISITKPYTKINGVLGNVSTCTYKSTTYTQTATNTEKLIIRKKTVAGLNTIASDLFLGTKVTSLSGALDPITNRLLLVWEEQSGTSKQILGQLIDSQSFTFYGSSNINISTGTGDRTSPAVAYDNVNQRFLTVWEDARNQSANISNIDIYSQFIDPQGNLSGANTYVTTASGNQLAPALAFGDFSYRYFFIVWKDGRNPADADLYGQLFQFSTLPQLVVADSAGTPITNSSIDFGTVSTGQSKDIIFKLKNDGNAPLIITSISAPSAPFSFVSPLPVNINPGTSYDLTVRFAPNAAGSFASGALYSTSIISNGGNTTVYFSGAAVGVQTLTIATPSLTNGPIGVLYSRTLQGSGGTAPYKWSIVSETVPLGGVPTFTINQTSGVLSGTPATAGIYTVLIQITDGDLNTATSSYSIKIGDLAISNLSTTFKTWTQGKSYGTDQVVTAAGNTGTVSWSVPAGVFPPGLLLDPITGIISDAPLVIGQTVSGPTAAGAYNFTVQATDTTTNETTTKQFSLTINLTPAISTSSLPNGLVGQLYQQQIVKNGGTGPFTWAVSAGTLPPGMHLDPASGLLSGTPQSQNTSTFTVSLTDSTNYRATQQFTLNMNASLLITTPSLPLASVGTAYSQILSATGGQSPYTWTVKSGALPAGLSLDPNGTILGSPTTSGNAPFEVSVTDQAGTVVSTQFNVLVGNGISLSNVSISGTGSLIRVDGVTLANLPTGSKPSDFNISTALDLEVSSTPNGGTVTFTIVFNSLPVNPVFYKVVGSTWTKLLPAEYTLNTSTRTLTFSVTDNSAYDSDMRSGIIRDPIVVGTESSTTAGTPGATGGAVTSNSAGGSGCFIATAAYGSYLDPHVMVLRHFRDDVLLQSESGTAFVKLYYTYSPPIADFIKQHDVLRLIIRFALTPLIFMVKYPLVAAISFVISLVLFIKRRLMVVKGQYKPA